MGYEVIVMDHPYETDIAEFPNGTIIYGGHVASDPNKNATLEFALDVRTADVPSFWIASALDILGLSGMLVRGIARIWFGYSWGPSLRKSHGDSPRILVGLLWFHPGERVRRTPRGVEPAV
jgi:hypothetical protein